MPGKVIVYGGRGGLGVVVVSTFRQAGYEVLSVDIVANTEAEHNVLVSLDTTWPGQEEQVCRGVEAALAGSKVEAVINVAGGWAGGNTADAEWVKNADLMWKQSVWSSAISATLASKFLVTGGLLVLPGAQPATGATPGMMGYGMAKAAVHQLVASLAAPGSGLPEESCVAAILPVTLDTPMNRKFMPGADTSTWTPLAEVGRLLLAWTEGRERFQSGSLVSLVTRGGRTRTERC